MAIEHIGKADRPLFADEEIILKDNAAGRQGAALRGDALDVTAQFNLLGKECCPRATVFGALVGKVQSMLGQLGGRGESLVAGHVDLLTGMSRIAGAASELAVSSMLNGWAGQGFRHFAAFGSQDPVSPA